MCVCSHKHSETIPEEVPVKTLDIYGFCSDQFPGFAKCEY